jgi:hypothetical protein
MEEFKALIRQGPPEAVIDIPGNVWRDFAEDVGKIFLYSFRTNWD